ncbi:MAG TPA: hypothetical protein VH988_04885 [Thermoanaerobaculia bacterium]|jgi:hypothetical protein|nr:hypothetical protein [Thermoanaerobaculia bacterium]
MLGGEKGSKGFGPVTAAMVKALQSARLWALFLALWCLIAAGLLSATGVRFLLGQSAVSGLPAGAPVWPVAAVALLAAAAVAALALPVFRFARSLTWVGGPDGEREIEWAMQLHRSVWRLLGLLTASLFAVALIASYVTSAHRHAALRAAASGLGQDKIPRFEDLPAACPSQGAQGETALLCTAVVRYDRQGRALARGDWVVLRGRAVKLSVGNGGAAGLAFEARVVPASGTWSILLDAPLGRPLLAGLYTGATGASGTSGAAERKRPRLDVSFTRPARIELPRIAAPPLPLSQETCPGSFSRFRIDRLSRAANGTLADVQADFERVCADPQGAWVLVGRIAARPGAEGVRR